MTDRQPYRHRFPISIIQYTLWLYHRFPISERDVQELLHQGRIDSRETSIPPEQQRLDLSVTQGRAVRQLPWA